ncbi:hypothetical protein [Bacillus cereus]|uniref:hypothetical protein n=1 Tax=Bacillus cereus TaxID=1396 RepID=UPI0018CECA50|nr:hypothetical protein [Bacillus cereus]MBG9716497.1 hypothetical protein [Bacillus cereus]
MQILLKILNKGDEVLNTWDNKISVKRKNGEVEIFTIIQDENSLPRISPDSMLITYGKREITVRESDTKGKGEDFEIGTF